MKNIEGTYKAIKDWLMDYRHWKDSHDAESSERFHESNFNLFLELEDGVRAGERYKKHSYKKIADMFDAKRGTFITESGTKIEGLSVVPLPQAIDVVREILEVHAREKKAIFETTY